MIWVILLILCLLLFGGGWTRYDTYGTWAYSPVLFVVVIFVVLWLLGVFH